MEVNAAPTLLASQDRRTGFIAGRELRLLNQQSCIDAAKRPDASKQLRATRLHT